MIFDKTHASLLASAAAASYFDPTALDQWSKTRGLTPQGFQAADTQGFVVSTADALHVVFRGTEPLNLRDWQTDAKAFRIPSRIGGSVHQGFGHALDAVWGQVETAVKMLGTRQLFLSGHSLGGALAVLAASRLPGIPLQLYTFGQPRVGNEEFAKAAEGMFGATYFRFVNDKDIVPRVPPFSAGYRHFGHELQIDSAGVVREVDFGVETLEDALRLAAGAQLPKAVSAVATPLMEVVDSVSRGKIELGPALQAMDGLLAFLRFFPGGGVSDYLRALKNRTSAIELIKKNPGAIESIADHDMALYLRAAESAV